MIEVKAHIPASQSQAQASAPLTPNTAKAIQAAKTAAAQQTPAVSQDALDQAFRRQLPELSSIVNAKLQLDIDQDSGQVIGRIVDRDSGELIKQIPSDDMLRLIAQTKELLGTLYDNSV